MGVSAHTAEEIRNHRRKQAKEASKRALEIFGNQRYIELLIMAERLAVIAHALHVWQGHKKEYSLTNSDQTTIHSHLEKLIPTMNDELAIYKTERKDLLESINTASYKGYMLSDVKWVLLEGVPQMNSIESIEHVFLDVVNTIVSRKTHLV